jgi:hypothetical protein
MLFIDEFKEKSRRSLFSIMVDKFFIEESCCWGTRNWGFEINSLTLRLMNQWWFIAWKALTLFKFLISYYSTSFQEFFQACPSSTLFLRETLLFDLKTRSHQVHFFLESNRLRAKLNVLHCIHFQRASFEKWGNKTWCLSCTHRLLDRIILIWIFLGRYS